jgi:hypothetical protein
VDGAAEFAGFHVAGRPEEPGIPRQTAQFRAISPGYFGAMRIPLRRGRVFDDRDRRDAPPVVVVNETLERR